MIEDLMTLAMLIFLQAVLGFDNLLYISLESKRVAEDQQQMVRRWGIGLAIVLRLVLLVVLVTLIERLKVPFIDFTIEGVFHIDMTVHAAVVLAGGLFIVYTAFKEIGHMLSLDDLGHDVEDKEMRSAGVAIAWIIVMNLVFSFDSILSAIALTDTIWVMATAIIISGIGMIVLADKVADFLKKNRLYEVLGLFILLLVGIMLLSEGGHLAHLTFLGKYHVEAMSKTTFYFSIAILVVVDIAQSRYQNKLRMEAKHALTTPDEDGDH